MPEPSILRRQRASRLSAVALLLAAIVFVIIDQALKLCLEDGSGSLNVTEPDAQNATLCSDCRSSDDQLGCRAASAACPPLAGTSSRSQLQIGITLDSVGRFGSFKAPCLLI